MAVYYGDFTGWADLRGIYDALTEEAQVIYAGYTYEDYSGSAFVLFVQDGVLYENHDGHCSCNGLENWRPEKADIRAVMKYEGWPGLQEAIFAYIERKLVGVEPLPVGGTRARAMRLRH